MNSWCLLALAGAMVGGCRSGGKPQERFETYYAEASPSGFTDRELNRLSKRAWAVVKAEPEESPRAFDALARVVDECARGGSYSRASRVRARAMSELIPRSRRDDVRTMRLIRALAPLGRFDAEEAEAEEREFAQYLDKIEAGRRGSAWVGAGVAWAKSHHRVERDLHVRTIPASERDEARQWISKCYYDAEHLPDSAWAREVRQFCSRGMNQLDQLVIGRNAPDLESTDFYSRRLRLSEYRGQVVVLSFWATWCRPCMAKFEDQREMVDRMRGRPFALLGVNSDRDADKAQTVVDRGDLNWRNFRDDPNAGAGECARRFAVRSWPSVFVLDADGVIRAVNPRRDDLWKICEELVSEAEETGTVAASAR